MSHLDRSFSRRQALKAGAGVAAAAAFVSYPKRSFAQSKTSIRMTSFASGADLDVINQQVASFTEANPDIEVKVETIPSDYPTKITTDLAAGTAADVFYVDSLLAPDLITRNLLLPLDDRLASEGGTDDFLPTQLGAYQLGGQTYGLPKDWSALATWYSQANLDSAGVTADQITSWDGLKTSLKTLTDSTGVPGAILAPDPARFFAFIYEAGGSIVSPDYSQVLIGDQATKDALEFYYGLYRDGLATTPADAGANDTGVGLSNGAASLTFEGNWNYGGYAKNSPDFKFGVAPMPTGPNGNQGTLAFTVAYSVYAGTKSPDAAFKLLSYLTGPEAMTLSTNTLGPLPTRKSLTAGWLEKFPERKVFADSASYARPWLLGPGGLLFNDDASGILQAVFAGSTSVDDAVSQLKAAAEKDIQLQAPGAGGAATPGTGGTATAAS